MCHGLWPPTVLSSQRLWQSEYAEPTWKSYLVATAGLLLGRTALSSVMSQSLVFWKRLPTAICDGGDLVDGIVRRPDPVPCDYCAAGEWDMCRNGRYTERGIKERDGYAAEQIRIEPDFAVRVDPTLGVLGVLLEPASVVAKAWDHAERIGRRSRAPGRALTESATG